MCLPYVNKTNTGRYNYTKPLQTTLYFFPSFEETGESVVTDLHSSHFSSSYNTRVGKSTQLFLWN